jgi:energy-converting hydrogenase Eha subunit F
MRAVSIGWIIYRIPTIVQNTATRGPPMDRSALSGKVRRPGRRGISKIAMVLVIVVVVVGLVFGLYYVFYHYYGTPAPAKTTVAFGPASLSTGKDGGSYENFTLSLSQNVSTNNAAFKIVSPSGAMPTSISANSVPCGETVTSCPASAGGWYAVLADPNGLVLNLWGEEGWTQTAIIQTADLFVVVSSASLAGSGNVLSIYNVAGPSISGSTSL